MRVMLVNSLYAPNFIGGAELSVQALAEGLIGLGHEATVICTADRTSNTEDEVNGVRVHYLAYRNRYWTYEDRPKGRSAKLLWHARDIYNNAMSKEVAAIARRERPDVAHTNNLAGMSVAVWDAFHQLGVPIVHTLRDYYLMCPRSTMYARGASCRGQCGGCSLFTTPRRTTSRRVAAAVGVSQFILDRHLHRGYFPGAVLSEAIHNGYEPGPAIAEPRSSRDPGRLVVGFLGNLSQNKGIEELLRAVDGLPEDRVELHIGGTGKSDYEASLRSRYARPNIHFRGKVAAAEFLRELDVLVVASRWEEPLGRVIVEALAVGIPVVTTPRGGTTELVKDGFNGLVSPGDDADDLRAALGRVLADAGLLTSLRQNIADSFRPETIPGMVGRYVRVYERVSTRRECDSRGAAIAHQSQIGSASAVT